MNVIDYKAMLNNIETMINLLEYDSMRSAGKCKLNSSHLVDLYSLKDRYETMVKKSTPAKKEG